MSTQIGDMANQIKIAIGKIFEEFKPGMVDQVLPEIWDQVESKIETKLKLLDKRYNNYIGGLKKELDDIKKDLKTYEGDVWEILKPRMETLLTALGAPSDTVDLLKKALELENPIRDALEIKDSIEKRPLTVKQLIGLILSFITFATIIVEMALIILK
jgi:hypothetical protein